MPTVIEKSGNNMGGEYASTTNPDKGRDGKCKKKCRPSERRVDQRSQMRKAHGTG